MILTIYWMWAVDDDDDDDDDVGVGDMKDVVGLEGTLQPSGLHQLFQNSYVGKTAICVLLLLIRPHQDHPF